MLVGDLWHAGHASFCERVRKLGDTLGGEVTLVGLRCKKLRSATDATPNTTGLLNAVKLLFELFCSHW